tara:strand:+ start:390 stop:620 length:231 start_codon:yes stop_codon:yes gene_type:complete
MKFGIGTLFRYKYPRGNNGLKYGVITNKNNQDETITIQWLYAGGGDPYSMLETDLISLLKSGDESSGIIHNTEKSC